MVEGLAAYCYRGLGTLYVTLGQRRQARGAGFRHRTVSGYGHDLLTTLAEAALA
jgi:hypothetical protein